MPGTHNVFAITKFLNQHMEECFRMFEIVLDSNDMLEMIKWFKGVQHEVHALKSEEGQQCRVSERGSHHPWLGERIHTNERKLAGNAVVLWLLGFRLRRNAFSVYILNLVGADFLFLSFQTAFALEELMGSFHSISRCNPSFVLPVLTFAYLASLSILSAISVERCVSVLWPIWYRCHCPRHTTLCSSSRMQLARFSVVILLTRWAGLPSTTCSPASNSFPSIGC
ncbi:Mas-Related G-Protein Coupled Receptor Member X2 [Manis pentadactyla]|nr:Mas-Related G-Protein Coupled Receptor Member X2 [Manis pentadactyla]